MVQAIRFHQTGGPEVLKIEDVAVGDPGPGQIRIRHTAAGLNYIDTYHRSGLYPLPLPSGIGMEGAGTVTAVGPDVTSIKIGDRVGYASGPLGSYSAERLMTADRCVVLPAGLSDETAAAIMLKGMTSRYLLRRTYNVKAGDTILVHAAAGGVGLIMCQWAKHLGATVIGTVGSDAKAALAKAHGCDHPIVYTREKFVDRVKEITGGKGLPVVYDSVGKDTFMGSLDCLQPLGLMVTFGNASGPVTGLDTGVLAAKGSLYLTRPSLVTYTAKRADLEETAKDLFDIVLKGAVKIEIAQRYPLKDAAQAHRDLEGRKTTGSTLLIP
ncbi:MAG: quinone oxidoreductase [Alphaproteobacteria bacterium]|nr:quinone oxidoreductase [Alphaproteobacteria bacterium]